MYCWATANEEMTKTARSRIADRWLHADDSGDAGRSTILVGLSSGRAPRVLLDVGFRSFMDTMIQQKQSLEEAASSDERWRPEGGKRSRCWAYLPAIHQPR